MRIRVYPDQKAVVAVGFKYGKRIKRSAVCRNGDSFDEAFGKELAQRKFEVAKHQANIQRHKDFIRELESIVNACRHELESQKKAILVAAEKKEAAQSKLDALLNERYPHKD